MHMRQPFNRVSTTILIVVLYSWCTGLLVAFFGNKLIPPRSVVLPAFPYGLSLAESSRSKFNLIFVHGLGSNPSTTWRKPILKDGVLSYPVSWVEDLLPYDLPNAQAWYFNYDSTVYNDAPRKTIGDIADELLLYLSNMADGSRLIFIAHSFGGLVVKEAVIRAALPGSGHEALLTSISSIIFLGTPHFGMCYAWYASWVARMLYMLHSSPQLHLQLHTNSSFLQRQHDEFIKHTSHVRVVNFFETRGTVIVKLRFDFPPLRVHLVPKESSTFHGPNTENHSIDTDHCGLNKYDSKEEPGYRKIVVVLRRLMQPPASPKASNLGLHERDQ